MADDKAGLLTRKQVGDFLQRRFFVTQKTDTLRVLFTRFGIAPVSEGSDPISGRGWVGYYDPLVVWVMATYFHWPKLATSTPDRAMESCMNDARRMRGGMDDEATKRLAYYSFICDPRWGLDIRILDSALASDPDLLDLSLDGRDVLKSVLLTYKGAVIAGTMGGREVDGVMLASDFPQIMIEGFGDATPTEWPFYGADGAKFFDAMERAGLYDPALDVEAVPTSEAATKLIEG